MKLFDATPSLINAVKDVMEKKMTKDELAALGGDKRKVDAEDFEALRNGEHKKKHKKKHHVKEEEIIEGFEIGQVYHIGKDENKSYFIPKEVQKNGKHKGMQFDSGAAGRSSKKPTTFSYDYSSSWKKTPAEEIPAHIKAHLKEDVEIINEIGDTPAGLARLKGYVDVQSAKQGPSMWIGKNANMVYKAKKKIENNTPLEHEPKVHDFRHMDDGSIYNRSQTDDKIKDGDVFHMSGNRVGFMYKAWPTMLHGDSEALHSFNPGKSAPPRYKASVAKANELKNMKEEIEQVDELDVETLKNYRTKASNQAKSELSKSLRGEPNKFQKRIDGYHQASDKIDKKVMSGLGKKAASARHYNEETEVFEGSTWGVDSPKRKKGQYASDDGRHVAKIHKKEDEYVVSIHSDGKHNAKADYFTDDKEDAHGTAKAMLAHAVKHAKPLKEASEIEEGKKEYTVYKMDKNNTVISIGSSEASRRHAMKLSNIGGKKFHKGQASGAVVVTKKDGKVQKVRPSHSKLVEETDKKKKAYQDGGNFYDEKSGKLLASHEDMVKGDYDIRGAKKAREHFNKNSKTHVCEEVETSLVSKIINKYTK